MSSITTLPCSEQIRVQML